MKFHNVLCTAALLGLLAAGCGQSSTPAAQSPASEIQSQQQSEPSPDEGRNTQSQDQPKPSPSENETPKTEKPYFAEAFQNHQIENNGGYFVRAGDRVFYRSISKKTLDQTALFGDFLDSEIADPASVLISYYPKTKICKELFKLNGNGPLFVAPEGFYISQNMISKTILIHPDTGKDEVICDGKPVGISEDGTLLAVQSEYIEGAEDGLFLYKEKKPIARLSTPKDAFYSFCGFWKDHMIAMHETENKGECALVSIDAHGNQTELGLVPKTESDADPDWIPQFKQFSTDETTAYLSFGFLQGTGHFVTDWMIVSVVPGVNDSLKLVESASDSDQDYEDIVPRFYLTESGKVKTAEQIKGDIVLSEGYYGDLLYSESPSDTILLSKDYIPARSDDDEDPEKISSFIQNSVAIGDTAYVIKAAARRNKEEDIGWREAYSLESLYFEAIPFGPDALNQAGNNPTEIIELEGTDSL